VIQASQMPIQHPSKTPENSDRSVLRPKFAGAISTSRSTKRLYMVQSLFVCVVLVAITWLVFGQTLRHDFVNFDDDLYVYDAPAIQAGLTIKGIALAFTNLHARNWHPLTTISHMADCQLYGLKARGHHATNVILHTIAVLLLFRLLWQMTGALWKSAVVAALFAIHPLHVESVAWVSERKDVLSAVFFFLMLGAYTRYARAPSVMRYLAVALLFGAGLMSKPMLVSAPIVLLLLDYWPLNRVKATTAERSQRFVALVVEKVPLLLLSVCVSVITFAVQKRAVGAIPPLPLLWRAENAFVSYAIYIWKTLWPTHLAVFYPHPNASLGIWPVVFATTLLLAISVIAIVLRRERPYLFTGWFWYVGMLIPVIGIVQVGEQGHGDRYMYLPHVGLFLLIVWLAADVLAVGQFGWRFAAATAAGIIVALGCAAFAQTSFWRNSETLWRHALAVTSDNDFAHNNLGYLCVDRDELDEAILHFETAVKIRSRKTDPHYSVGSAFVEMNLADALARKGRPDEAMVHFEQAIKLQPNYADAYYNRGNVLFAKGRIEEAISDWEKTLKLRPDDADAHTCLGNALLRQGLQNEAITHYQTAAALAPNDFHSRNNMAWLMATSSDDSVRDGAKAVELAEQAVALSGGKEPNFIRTLAAAYAENGRFDEAIAVAQHALALAAMQGKSGLTKVLQNDITLYRADLPLRGATTGDH
jgi:protein O-mannosyl-transferase